MAERRRPPESPTEIAAQTGLGVPGVTGADARLARPPISPLVRPGQSGAEGLAELPNARPADPADGP